MTFSNEDRPLIVPLNNAYPLKSLNALLLTKNSYQKELRVTRRWKSIAKVFAIITASAIGAVGAVAVYAVFPAAPLWVTAAVFVGGLVIESFKYWRDNQRSFKIFGIDGVVKDIEHRIYKRELLHQEHIAFIRLQQQKNCKSSNSGVSLLDSERLLEEFKQDKRDYKREPHSSSFIEKYGCDYKTFHKQWLAHRKSCKEYIELCFSACKHFDDEDFAANNSKSGHPTFYFKQQLIAIRNNNHLKFTTNSWWGWWQRYYHNVNYEIKIKRVLGVLAGIWAVGNGIGFGALMFMHLNTLFAATTTLVWLSAAMACGIGICVGVGYWMLMYMLLNKAVVKNIFWKKILKPLTRLFYIKGWKDITPAQRASAFFKNIITIILIAALIVVSVLVNLASSGTWLKSTVCFYNWLASLTNLFAVGSGVLVQALAGITVLLFMTPVAIMFSFENGFETAKKVGASVKHLWYSLWSSNANNSERKSFGLRMAIKYLLLTVLALFLVVCFAFHVFGEGGVAGEGVNDKEDMFVSLFESLSRFIEKIVFIRISPASIAVILNVVVESGEDGIFTVRVFDRFKARIARFFDTKPKATDEEVSTVAMGHASLDDLDHCPAVFKPLFIGTDKRVAAVASKEEFLASGDQPSSLSPVL